MFKALTSKNFHEDVTLLPIAGISEAYVKGFPMNWCTRDTGAQGNKCDSIDAVFEVDEATKVAGNISDDCGANTDASDGNHKSGVAIGNPLKIDTNQSVAQCAPTVLIFLVPIALT